MINKASYSVDKSKQNVIISIAKALTFFILIYMYLVKYFFVSKVLLIGAGGILTILMAVHVWKSEYPIHSYLPAEQTMLALFVLFSAISGFFVAVNIDALNNMILRQIQTFILVMCILVISYYDDSTDFIEKLLIIVPLIMSVVILSELESFLGALRERPPFYRTGLETINPNTFGTIQAFAIFAVIARWRRLYSNNKFGIIGSIVLILFFMTMVLLSGSRKSLLAAIIIVFGFIIVMNKKTAIIGIIGAVATLGALLALPLLGVGLPDELYVVSRFSNFFTENSNSLRFELYKESVVLFKESPIVGIGMGNFRHASTRFTIYSHSTYAEILACTGLVGSLLYYAGSVVIGYKLWFVYKQRENRIFFWNAMVLIAMMLFMGAGTIHIYDKYPWILFAYLHVGMISIFRSKTTELSVPPRLEAIRKKLTPSKVLASLGRRGHLKWIPDKYYLMIFYKSRFGKRLHLNPPVLYTEKLQWLKLNDRKPEYTTYVDKFSVRNFVAEKIGEDYLVPLYGVYDKPEDIVWEELPSRFVLKVTHASRQVTLCSDKSKLDIQSINQMYEKKLAQNMFWAYREWPYKHVMPRIICEQFLSDGENAPCDYKVLCFEGSARLIEYHKDRFGEHTQDFYDRTWALTSISQKGIPSSFSPVEKPKLLSLMLDLSEQLAHNIPHVRVDWYIFKGRLYFGEMTFFDSSGFTPFDRIDDDRLLGSWVTLPKKGDM
jgi:O-antigen ligase